MYGYQLNMSGPLLDYAMKTYTSHRMFPSAFVVQELENVYKQHVEQTPVKIERKYDLVVE